MPDSVLYHFTCHHAAERIDIDRVLRPQVSWRQIDEVRARDGEPLTGLWQAPPVVWLTNMTVPDVRKLGLTSVTLRCDRTEFRYSVEAIRCVPWLGWAIRHGASNAYLRTLTGDPRRWWVAEGDVPVLERRDLRSGAKRRMG